MKLLLIIGLLSHAAHSAVVTEEVRYAVDGTEMIGVVVKPEKIQGKVPGILVVHEWWGQTDYPRRRAKMLAELGYVAMAVDMYGGAKTADHPKDAGAFAGAVMKDAATVGKRFNAALRTLSKVTGVDDRSLGAIGYCFGGSVVQEMAKQGAPLKAVVSFHGGLATPSRAEAGKSKTKILLLHGADDTFVSKEAIAHFHKEMKSAGMDYEFVSYPNAKHGFTNPGATARGKKNKIPLAYNEKADKQSWKKMQEFLKKNL